MRKAKKAKLPQCAGETQACRQDGQHDGDVGGIEECLPFQRIRNLGRLRRSPLQPRSLRVGAEQKISEIAETAHSWVQRRSFQILCRPRVPNATPRTAPPSNRDVKPQHQQPVSRQRTQRCNLKHPRIQLTHSEG